MYIYGISWSRDYIPCTLINHDLMLPSRCQFLQTGWNLTTGGVMMKLRCYKQGRLILQACGYIATRHITVKLFCWKHVEMLQLVVYHKVKIQTHTPWILTKKVTKLGVKGWARWTGAMSCIYLVQGWKVHELLQNTMFSAWAVNKDNSFSCVRKIPTGDFSQLLIMWLLGTTSWVTGHFNNVFWSF